MPSNWVHVSEILPQLIEDFKNNISHKRTEDRMTFEDWEAQPDPEEGDDE